MQRPHCASLAETPVNRRRWPVGIECRAAPVSCRKPDLPASLICRIASPSPSSRHVSESCAAVICCKSRRLADWLKRNQSCRLQETSPEATQVRSALALFILISCAGCADFQKLVAQGPAPQPAVAPTNPPPASPAPVADVAPARFECSDGTISSSQDACLIAMARARLPPSSSAASTTATAR